jgi:SPP1 gp7 family putative phage head morphogenesis protein
MNKKNKKTKKKIAAPVKSQKTLEKQYQKELNKLGRQLTKAISTEVLPFLKSSQKEYVLDNNNKNIISYDSTLSNKLNLIFRRLNSLFTGTITLGFAKNTASKMVDALAINNKRRFNKSIESLTGVNFGGVVRSEGLDDLLTLSKNKNEILITSLPEEYLKQVETIVTNGVINGTKYSDIAEQITARVGSANAKLSGRIKTIATNEVQTINSQISLRRTEALGIKKGIYMTVSDESVRKCHAELDGVEYDLKKGAWSKTCKKYIQPGITDINCRCSFRPVLELDN